MSEPLIFTTESLIAEATELAGGRNDFGEPQFLEGLERFVRSLRDDARLNMMGQHIAVKRSHQHLTNRLNYSQVYTNRVLPEQGRSFVLTLATKY